MAEALARGRRDGIGEADGAMLDYAVKLTRHPGAMTREDTGLLRAAGFGDRAILDICQVVSYYNYVNRLADGLGVELEAHWTLADQILTREDFEARRQKRKIPSPRGAPPVDGA